MNYSLPPVSTRSLRTANAWAVVRSYSARRRLGLCVRCRPLNDKEHTDGRQRIVSMDTKTGQCSVIAPGSDRHGLEPPKNFTFDQVYDESVSQEYIYMNTASRIVDSVLEGFNGTIFA